MFVGLYSLCQNVYVYVRKSFSMCLSLIACVLSVAVSSRLKRLCFFLLLTAEKLCGRKLNVAEVTQSEIGQKQKLQMVLEAVNEQLRPHGWSIEWSVDCEWLLFLWTTGLHAAVTTLCVSFHQKQSCYDA